MKAIPQVNRLLMSIGKSVFVEHFELFRNTGNSPSEIIAHFTLKYGYSEKASSTRVSKARKIFSEGLVEQALELVLASNKISTKILDKARILLKKEAKNINH